MNGADAGGTDAMIECWRVRVHGRVQGVGYRQVCIEQARALGITGWVRNRLDGSVEATLQGSPQQRAQMSGWLRAGVAQARVDDVDVAAVPPPFARFDRFERWPTA